MWIARSESLFCRIWARAIGGRAVSLARDHIDSRSRALSRRFWAFEAAGAALVLGAAAVAGMAASFTGWPPTVTCG